MNQEALLKANSNAIERVEILGRYMTILECSGTIEIKAPDMASFEVDVADEIDFGHIGEDGIWIQVRNLSGAENKVIFADSPVRVVRKKRVAFDSDLPVVFADDSSVALAAGSEVALAAGSQIEVTNHPVKKHTVVFKTLTWAAGDDADKEYNNGDAVAVLMSSADDITLNGSYQFVANVDLPLNNLAVNQDFILTGAEGQSVSIIEYLEV